MSITNIAHIRTDGTKLVEQTVLDHNLQVAKYAAAAAAPAGMKKVAFYAGLIHDAGKCKKEYGLYITGVTPGVEIDHSSIPLQYVLTKYHGSKDPAEVSLSELVAYVVGAHHGLFDCDLEGIPVNNFERRLAKKTTICYDEAMDNFFRECIPEKKLERYWDEALAEYKEYLDKVKEISILSKAGDVDFLLGMNARMVLSALMEGDCRDTAEFFANEKYHPKTANKKEWERRLKHVDKLVDSFPKVTAIDKSRGDISQRCKDFAVSHQPGIYRLNTPAGAGKTLSGTRYAVAHAMTYRKKRIVFTAPLLGIIDQNAPIIRKAIGGGERTVMEHHSNMLRNDKDVEASYALESWHNPVIVTTMVQMLNTLFGGRKSYIRRFQALCDTVLVMDEVHTIPPKMLTIFNQAITYLSEFCGATVILCSATQPALEKAQHPLLKKPEDIVPYDPALWAAFARTKIEEHPDTLSMFEIGALADKMLKDYDSLLIVCNTKKEASDLYYLMEKKYKYVFHLSASMCMDHRRRTLKRIYSAFPKGKVICVSTQVIEAGIDISFDAGIRIVAGMDSVVQTAGRVNRNGKAVTLAPMKVVRLADEQKDLIFLDDIRKSQDATLTLLSNFRYCPAAYDHDLASDKSIDLFWRDLYRRYRGQQDFPVLGEKETIFNLMGENTSCRKRMDGYIMHQSFKTAADLFKVFDDNSQGVIVPYGGGAAIIRALKSPRALADKKFFLKKMQQARKYTVNVFDNQIEKLIELHAVEEVCGGQVLVLSDTSFYSKTTGVLRV